MSLIPPDFIQRLIANGMTAETDHVPVVKLFHPLSGAAWLLCELNPTDNDTLFGLCDLGMGGVPTLGTVSLAALQDIKDRMGVGIQCDTGFVGRYPISVYAEAADTQGAITTIPSLLEAAAERLRQRRNNGGGP